MAKKDQTHENFTIVPTTTRDASPVRRGGGQGKPRTPSGTRRMWQPPTRLTTSANRHNQYKTCPRCGTRVPMD